MNIDATEERITFSLSEHERLELLYVFSKFRLVSLRRYLKFFIPPDAPTISIQQIDGNLMTVLVVYKHPKLLYCPARIIAALSNPEIHAEVGHGALTLLREQTNLFDRLKRHGCI